MEQDKVVILFLNREAYYEKDSEGHSIEIIISKNRNGHQGELHRTRGIHTINRYNLDQIDITNRGRLAECGKY